MQQSRCRAPGWARGVIAYWWVGRKMPGLRTRCKQLIPWAALLLLGIVLPLVARAEPVTLSYKSKPGQELRYTLNGGLKQKMNVMGNDTSVSAKFSGTLRLVVAEAIPEKNAFLLGSVGTTSVEMEMDTGQGQRNMTQEQGQFQAMRLDRFGRVVPRKKAGKKDEDPRGAVSAMFLKQLEGNSFLGGTLSDKPVDVGSKWSSDAGVPLMGAEMPCSQEAELKEFKTINGRRCAVIALKFSSAKDAKGPLGRMEISGDGSYVFDIERGIGVATTSKLKIQFRAGGGEANMELDLSGRLTSARQLPPDEAARSIKAIEALDSAVALLYEDKTDEALGVLEKVRPTLTEEDWKKGLDQSIKLVKQMKQFASGTAPNRGDDEEKLDDAGGLMKDADGAAAAGRWQDAVEKYTRLADKHPDHKVAPQALAAAAAICEKHLKDKEKAAALRARLIATQEEAGKDADPLKLYKLAGTYANAGKLDKAIDAYRKVAASPAKDLPPRTRVLAQYRAAGLLARQGKTQEAVAAYRAVDGIKADDDYSKRIKQAALKKAGALAGGK